MAARKPKVYNLAEVIERELAADDPIRIEAGGTVFEVPSPLFWPDAVYSVDDPTAAKILLGDKQYAAWCATETDIGGVMYPGTAKLFFAAIKQSQGVGVSRPE